MPTMPRASARRIRSLAAPLLLLTALAAACSNNEGAAAPPTTEVAEPTSTTTVPATTITAAPTTTAGPTTTASATTASTTSTTIAPTTTTTVWSPRSVSVIAGGDVLAETPVTRAAKRLATAGARFDFTPLLAPLQPLVAAADLAICHLETPLSEPGGFFGDAGQSKYGGHLLVAPDELAAALAATGFDRCSTASNHALDAGSTGVSTTLDVLDSHGITHAGTARSEAESNAMLQPFLVNGVRVSHLAYTRTSNTGAPRDPWTLHTFPSVAGLAADVAAARNAGAELVVVTLHLSVELERRPVPADRKYIEELVAAAPIDLVIVHGPHVVQRVTTVGSTPVFWSVGNLISGMGTSGSGRYEDPRTIDGLLASVTFTETSPGVFAEQHEAIAICVDPTTRTVYPASHTLAAADNASTTNTTVGPPSERLQRVLRQCLARTRSVVRDAT